jgi:hypothetical protein
MGDVGGAGACCFGEGTGRERRNRGCRHGASTGERHGSREEEGALCTREFLQQGTEEWTPWAGSSAGISGRHGWSRLAQRREEGRAAAEEGEHERHGASSPAELIEISANDGRTGHQRSHGRDGRGRTEVGELTA